MLLGISVIKSEFAVRKEFRRVPGGYMNHWLIRIEVKVPCVIHDRISNRLFVHPTLLALSGVKPDFSFSWENPNAQTN